MIFPQWLNGLSGRGPKHRRAMSRKSLTALVTLSDRSPLNRAVERLEDRTLLSAVWISEGPGPSQNGQVEGIENGEVAGAIHAVLTHPTDADTIYVGSVNGGVWKTTNATNTVPDWTPQFDNQSSLSIGAMAMDPTDPERILVGIGRFSSFGFTGGGLTGVVLTTDGGDSWSEINDPLLQGESISGVAIRGDMLLAVANPFFSSGGLFRRSDVSSGFTKISGTGGLPDVGYFDLVGDPGNPDRFYVGGQAGIFRSDDAGLTWTDISGAAAALINESTNNLELAIHNDAGNETNAVYAVVVNNGNAVGIFRSDAGVDGIDNDGDTTTDEPDENNFVAMDVPATLESPVAVTDASNTSPIVITSEFHGLNTGNRVEINGVIGNNAANGTFTITQIDDSTFSLDGSVGDGDYTSGGVWRQVSSLNPRLKPGSQGATHLSVVADPSNPFVVYVGGDRQDQLPNSIGANDFTGRLFRGDASIAPLGTPVTVGVPNAQWVPLTHLGTVSNSAPHADSRDMAFDANGNLIEVDDGGIYRRTNPSTNSGDWFSLNDGLRTTEQHDIAYDSLSNVLISGNQDTGTTYQFASGNTTWNSLHTGDGGDVAVDDTTLADNNQSIRYTSFQNLGGFRRTVWDASGGLVDTVFPSLTVTDDGAELVAQFNTPIALNEVDPRRLLIVGGNSVYESFDQGETITEIDDGAFDAYSEKEAVAYGHRTNADVIYLGLYDGVLVRTTTGDSLVATSTEFPGDSVRDLVMDSVAENADSVFVADNDQVYLTMTAGDAWTDITGNLDVLGATDFWSLAFVPGNVANAVVLGTATGAYYATSEDYSVWAKLGEALPNVLVYDLDYDAMDGVLVAGTMGRGAWTLANAAIEMGLVTPDFGDAPSLNYPTLLADDGARHLPVGPRLGSERDGELDGQPTVDADGDDLDLVFDDEDGVRFLTQLLVSSTGSTLASVEIDLQNADTMSNQLDAWLDFNADGDWDDADEQIFTNLSLGTVSGNVIVSFTVPQVSGDNVVTGTTYARFRLSSAGGLSTTGLANNGEIEDYRVTLTAADSLDSHVIFLPSDSGTTTIDLVGKNIRIRRGETTIQTLPFGQVNRLEFHGSDGTNDGVAIDLSGGDPIPLRGIQFHDSDVGEDANGNGILDTDEDTNNNGVLDFDFDSLEILNSNKRFSTLTTNYDNAHDGQIQLKSSSKRKTLEFSGLEYLFLNVISDELNFNLSNFGDDVAFLIDIPNSTSGVSQLRHLMQFTGTSFPFTNFPVESKTRLVVNANGGDDYVRVQSVDPILTTSPTLDGGSGNDFLDAVDSTIRVFLNGGEGDDYLRGGQSVDTLRGGIGNDHLLGGGGNDLLDGGTGEDRSEILVTKTKFKFTHRSGSFPGQGRDSLTSIEGFELSGDDQDNLIDASFYKFGPVTIRGGGGDDTIIGTVFNDVLDGQDGIDLVKQSASQSQFLFSDGDANGFLVRPGLDSDVIYSMEQAHLTATNRQGSTIDARSFEGEATLVGGRGDDYLYAATSRSQLIGNEGNDVLFGGGVSDTLSGGSGNDFLVGEDGDDVIRGDEGRDTIYGRGGDDFLFGGNGNDAIIGGDGEDSINGGTGQDTLSGEGGDDTVQGAEGNDAISGGFGNDFLKGGLGNDTILGDAGQDTLQGEVGADKLVGGDDDDRFETSDDLINADANEAIIGLRNRIDATFAFDFESLLP